MTQDEIKPALDLIKGGGMHPIDATILLADILEYAFFSTQVEEADPGPAPTDEDGNPLEPQPTEEENVPTEGE